VELGTEYIGIPENSVAFTNARSDQVITGVAMDDLPYYALFALIVGAGVAFMVIKYRKAAKYSEN
jgi:hypothetical protein